MRAWAFLLVLVACKHDPPPDEPLTSQKACDKLLTFRGDAGKRADERARCIADYDAMTPSLKTCTDKCVKQSNDQDQFDDCRDLCTGKTMPPFLMCSRVAFEHEPFQACMKKHEALQKEHADQYACWTRCVRRAKEGPEAGACDATCKIP